MIRAFAFLLAMAGAAMAQDSRSAGWIVIPVSDYSALRARAYPIAREAGGPPVEATLSRVDYDLRVDGDIAAGRAVLTVDVLSDGWVRVPVPTGLAVRGAEADGKPASLSRAGGLAVLLSKRGRSTITLDIAVPVASAGGEERLSLPSSESGVTRAAVAVTRPDVEVSVVHGLLAEQSNTEGLQRWVAFAGGSEALGFTWRRKMEEQKKAPQAVRMRGKLAQLVALGEDANAVSAEASIEIIQGAARSVRLTLPPAITVNAVTGASVADWETGNGELTVSLLDAATQSVSFVVTGELRAPREGSIDVPLLRMLDCERETSGVAVEVGGAGEIKAMRPAGLERVDAAELGGAIAARQSPSLVAFRYRTGSAERSLSLDVVRYAPQAVLTANVDEARYTALIAPDGKALIEARYAVRNNQRNFLRIALPAGASLWSASVAGRPVRPGRGPDGSLLFPLAKSRAGEDAPVFEVEVMYLGPGAPWSDKGRVSLTLPAVDLPVSRTGLSLYFPPNQRVVAEPGTFRVQPFEQPASAVLLGNTSAEAEPPPRSATPAQALVDGFRTGRYARRAVEATPLRVSFPAVGPSIYLASELTADNQAAVIELSYQRDRKGDRP